MNWQPIDTCPKTGEQFLVFEPLYKCKISVAQWGTFNEWSGLIYSEAALQEIIPEGPEDATHWMPIPAPPKET